MYSFKDLVAASDPRMGDDEWLEYMRAKRKRSLDGVSTEEVQEDEQQEALDLQTRRKLAIAMKRNKAKIKRAKEIASKKRAPKEKIEKRAKKQAINIIKKKLANGKDPSKLSLSARQDIEKRAEKKKAVINKLAKRLFKKVRKDDMAKLIKKPAADE
jgi:hypothetical protein